MSMRWLWWHVTELVAVGAPAVAAWLWSPWWALLAGLAGLAWCRHELVSQPTPPPVADASGQRELPTGRSA